MKTRYVLVKFASSNAELEYKIPWNSEPRVHGKFLCFTEVDGFEENGEKKDCLFDVMLPIENIESVVVQRHYVSENVMNVVNHVSTLTSSERFHTSAYVGHDHDEDEFEAVEDDEGAAEKIDEFRRRTMKKGVASEVDENPSLSFYERHSKN